MSMRRTHQSDAEVFHLPQQKSSRKLEEFKWASETRKCQQSGTVERRHFTALDRCGQYENDEVELIIPYCPAVGNRWQLHSHYKADLSENCVESVLRRNAIVGGEDRVVPSDLIPQRRWTNPWQSDQNRFVKPTWDDRFRENFHCNQVEEEEWVYKRRTAANWGGKQRLRGVWRTESYAKAVGSVCYEDLESTDCEMPSATEAGTESSKMTDLWNANGNGCENSCVKNKTLIIVGDPMGENSVGATNNFSTGRYRKKNDSGGVRWRTKGFPRRKLQVISTSTWSSELERSSKWPLVDITAEEKSQKSSAASIAEIYGSEMSRLTPPTCQGGLDSSGYCVSRSLPNCLSIGETNVENKSDFNGSSVIVGKEKVSRESAVHIVISEPTTSAQSSGNQWKTVGGGRLNDFLVLRSTSGNPSPPGDNFSVEIGRSVCRQNYSADNKLGLRHNCGEEKLTAGPSVTKEKQNVLATYISSRRVENGGGMSASTAGVVRNHFSDGQISRQCQGCPDPNVVIVGGESVPTRGDFPSPLSSTQQRLSTLKEMPIRVDISLSSRNPSTVWVQSGVAPFGFDTELLETPMFHTRNGCGGRRRLFSSTAVRPDLSGSSEVSREETDRLTIISDSLTSTTADPSGLLSHSRDSNGHIATGAAETEEANFGSTECPLRPELGELMSSKHAELTQFVIADDLTPNRVLIKQNLSPQFGLLDKNAPVEAECQLGPTQLANIEADTTANDNTAGLSSSSSSSSNLLKSTCATTTADEVELSVGTKEFQVDSPGRRMRATEESNRSEVTERNGSAICTSLLTPPAVVGGNRTDRILAPRKTAVTSAAAAAVTTTTLSAASFIPGKLTPRPDVVTISSEKIGFIPTCSAGKLTPPDNTDELSCSLLTTSALSTTTATKMKFPAEVRLGTDEILISDADGVVCVAGTAGSRSPLCGVPPTFLLNSPAAVEVLNSSVGSVDGFEVIQRSCQFVS